MTDRYFAYLDRYEQGYREIIAALTTEFGTPFCVYHTGGGCMALEATVENGYLLITDAEDTLSPMDERIEAQASDVRFGYAVGIYDKDGETIAYVSDSNVVTTEDLTALVHRAFDVAATGGGTVIPAVGK